MVPSVRFAPSPTGLLHLGNARTALLNALFALRYGGKILLRLDDTDPKRSQETYTRCLLQDLEWLGFPYHAFVRQSDRLEAYAEAVHHLKKMGRLYPCYETEEELEARRRLQAARGQAPVYDRAALSLTDAERQAFADQGRVPHWRFFLNPEQMSWTDLVRGPVCFQAAYLSDPVLVRQDGSVVYTLASVVDDIALGVTHILRGEDHVTNTAVQIQLMEALGAQAKDFSFGHFPLIVDKEGQGFSKRLGSLSLQQLRAENIHPLAICSVLAALGTADGPRLGTQFTDWAEGFDLEKFGRATPKLDIDQLWHMNGKLLQFLPFSAVQPLLTQAGLGHIDAVFWAAFQGNIQKIEEMGLWWGICYESVEPSVKGEGPFFEAALALLPPSPWTEETWGLWTKALTEATGIRGRKLFHPLRLALTGQEQGPEMKHILPFIAEDQVRYRLGRAATQ